MAYGEKKKPCAACAKKMRKEKPAPKKKPKSKSEGEDVDFDSIKEGALKKQLGYPEDSKIPKSVLSRIKRAKVGTSIEVNGKNRKITNLLHKRVNFALNFGYKKK